MVLYKSIQLSLVFLGSGKNDSLLLLYKTIDYAWEWWKSMLNTMQLSFVDAQNQRHYGAFDTSMRQTTIVVLILSINERQLHGI